MRNFTLMAAGLFVAGAGLIATGCQSNDVKTDSGSAPVAGHATSDDGMNRTGTGADNGSSASGLDRAGGGMTGTHADNSTATGGAPNTNSGGSAPSITGDNAAHTRPDGDSTKGPR